MMSSRMEAGRALAQRRLVAAGLSLVVSSLGLAACGGGAGGSSTSPGVTDDEIVLGSTQALTGPAAPYAAIGEAIDAYFQYVNDKGGVHGRSIRYLVEDDGYNPSHTATKTRKLVLEDKVFAMVGSLGTPTQTAVLDFLTQNKVPNLFPSSGSRSWNQPEKHPATFGFSADYTVEGKILGHYISENFPGEKVCFFGQADDVGTDGLAGIEKELEVAESQEYVPTNTNVAPQIGALKSANCEVVVAFTTAGFTALTLGTAARQDFKPQWVVTGVGSDVPTLRSLLGEGTDALTEGVVTTGFLPPSTGDDNSWIQLFKEINEEYNDGARFDFNVVYGMSVAYTTVQALLQAGEDLTREKLIEALETGDFAGPVTAPFRWSGDVHAGAAGVRAYTIKNGKLAEASPLYTTDDEDGEIVEYTQEQADAPEGGVPE